MELSEFILCDMESILLEWDDFAAIHVPAAARMSPEALRDHSKQILTAVAKDLSTPQTKRDQEDKSKGLAPESSGDSETAAQTHAILRAKCGFDINELVSEYRALRACVLRRWMKASQSWEQGVEDIVRFNEAIDQAIAESIAAFTILVDQERDLMLGVLSHDMRSPLTTILMTASYLEAINAGEAISEAAFLLKCGCNSMTVLLDNMVDFNRSICGLDLDIAFEDIDLATTVDAELKQLRGAHPDRQLDLEVVGDVRGHWDGPRLQRVLRNLVSNAISYGTPGTPVHTLIIGKASDVRLEVSNSGPNIPQSDLDQVFTPFKRGSTASLASAAGGSQGLGLYIVREIAHAHGGEVDVVSADGTTVFGLRLPGRKENPSS